MSDCPNDCTAPLLFPKSIFNRPGLSRIGYRIGTYSDFREALLRKLDLDPVLQPWSYRGADDPGIALIESASILGDILTFYQEVYANELYLPTATLPQSIAGLVRLLGYRPSPGVGGQGMFAFEASGSKPLTIPAGFPITADLAALPDTVTFETVSENNAVPALSKFALYAPFTVPAIGGGAAKFAIATEQLANLGVALEKEDRLMLIDPTGGSDPYHQIAVIDKVEERFELTEITVKGTWLGDATATVTAYKLGRDFRHFGYNAPAKETVVDSGGSVHQNDVNFRRSIGPLIPIVSLGGTTSYTYAPVNGPTSYPLDSAVDDVAAGTTFLLSMDLIRLFGSSASKVLVARKVMSVQKGSLTLGSLTGAATVLQLDSPVASGFLDTTDIRSVQIYETASAAFTLSGARTPFAGPTSKLYFFGNGEDYRALDHRSLQLNRNQPAPGQDEAVEQVTAAIQESAVGDVSFATLRPVTLQPALQKFSIAEFPHTFPEKKPPVWVYGNLALATQGKTAKPVVLGSGDSRAIFQTFAIPKPPLTYLVSTSATPPEVPQLIVTVDGLEWQQLPSMIGSGSKDRVYIVREDSAGQSFVQFGDGKTGALLPSGVGNIAATYRTGVGAFGPLKPGASANEGAKLTGLTTISLLDEATGGAPPEDPSNVRQAAPGKVQSLGRMVSLRDYETEALGIPGASVAAAAWQIVDGVPTVTVTVLMETGRAAEFSAVTTLLNNYNVCRGPQRFPILAIQGKRNYVFTDLAIALAPSYHEDDVFARVQAALIDLFSPPRGFGAREFRSRIEGVVQDVAGVLWNSVTALGRLGPADDPATLILPPPPRSVEQTVPCDGNTLLALFPSHLTLSAIAAPVKVC